MGLSFAAWNARTRVEEAKRLLEIDDLSITAVAMAVGYRDVTTFERTFWRCEQLCPREYKRHIAEHTWKKDKKRRNQDKKRRDCEATRLLRYSFKRVTRIGDRS